MARARVLLHRRPVPKKEVTLAMCWRCTGARNAKRKVWGGRGEQGGARGRCGYLLEHARRSGELVEVRCFSGLFFSSLSAALADDLGLQAGLWWLGGDVEEGGRLRARSGVSWWLGFSALGLWFFLL